MTIYKYVINVGEAVETTLRIPGLIKVLSTGLDGRRIPCIWVLTKPGSTVHKEKILVLGTGIEYSVLKVHKFVGTIFSYPLVWHVFYKEAI